MKIVGECLHLCPCFHELRFLSVLFWDTATGCCCDLKKGFGNLLETSGMLK